MGFTKAVKHDAKLRMSIAGPSGSGKTFTALTLATALANGQDIALIDTERGSASKYADMFSFDVSELDNFHPKNFIAGIHEAEQAGYTVLIIDSLTHAWNGTGGLLDIVDEIAKRKYRDNSFAAWKDATPIQNALIDAITASPLHIIVTMRSKQEYAMEVVNGKSAPKKMGMAPIQRDGMEYEFDVAVDMDIDNSMIVQKSRCSALSGRVIAKPDKKVIDVLKPWLSGVERPVKRLEAQQGVTEENDTQSISQSTSTPTGRATNAHTNKTDQPTEIKKLEDIPSARQLFSEIDDGKVIGKSGNVYNRRDVLALVFRKDIDSSKGAITIESLMELGNELSPEYCQRLDTFLARFRQQRAA